MTTWIILAGFAVVVIQLGIIASRLGAIATQQGVLVRTLVQFRDMAAAVAGGVNTEAEYVLRDYYRDGEPSPIPVTRRPGYGLSYYARDH